MISCDSYFLLLSFCTSVPAAVRSLLLAGRSTEELQVAWQAAQGDVDHYEVQLLFNDMKVFPPLTLGSSVTACRLSSLTPGRRYKVLVSTFSGPNQRAQFIEGRTGEQIFTLSTSLNSSSVVQLQIFALASQSRAR